MFIYIFATTEAVSASTTDYRSASGRELLELSIGPGLVPFYEDTRQFPFVSGRSEYVALRVL